MQTEAKADHHTCCYYSGQLKHVADVRGGRTPMAWIGQTPVFSKRDAVRLFLAARGMDIRDVEPETLAYWLASSFDAVRIAKILLGVEAAPDTVLKGGPQ